MSILCNSGPRCSNCVFKMVQIITCYPKCTVSTTEKTSDRIRLPPTTPENIKHDWVGPPDPVSNIRPTVFHVPKDETALEKQYRLKREELQTWNHAFWAKHNRNFQQEKSKFIEEAIEKQKLKGEALNKRLSPEELSVFYKKFLDDNYRLHKQYNKDWYRKNIALLWPAFKVNVERLVKKGR